MKTKDQIKAQCQRIQDMLIAKNQAYGDSAINPVRIFSSADPAEQIKVRIDDKLSRLSRGNEYPGDDTIDDLIGFLVLLKIANADKPSTDEAGATDWPNQYQMMQALEYYGWQRMSGIEQSTQKYQASGQRADIIHARIPKENKTQADRDMISDAILKIATLENLGVNHLTKEISDSPKSPEEDLRSDLCLRRANRRHLRIQGNDTAFRNKLSAYLSSIGWMRARTDDSDLWSKPNAADLWNKPNAAYGLWIDKDLMTINQLKGSLTKIASDEGMSYEMLIKRIQLHASEPGELRTA